MNPKILIVEDDPEMAEVLHHGFEQEYLAPTIAGDGETGLRLAQQGTYQTIVLDVMLPGMDGFDFARSLRQSGNRTPILLLTARDSISDVVYGLGCGAEDYVVKPFSFLELSARVRSLIRRNQPETTVLRAGDLVLNMASRYTSRAGKSIALTRGEFQLLETLMRHAGLVVRRRQLIDAVWGHEVQVDDNNLDVMMSALRNRIDRGFSSTMIRTVRGVGYRLEAEPLRARWATP